MDRASDANTCVKQGEGAPSEMLTALANLGGSCAAASAEAALPASLNVAPLPACMPFKACFESRECSGEAVGTGFPPSAEAGLAALPGCMPFMAGAGLGGKLGKGLSSGGLGNGLACWCSLACLRACLGWDCPTCPAQHSHVN